MSRRMFTTTFRAACCPVLACALAACAVGPDYHRPDFTPPAAYKESDDGHAADWKPAAPADALQRGAWWEMFGDPVLNDLERRIELSNQSLKQAEAQYRQASALVSAARATMPALYWFCVICSDLRYAATVSSSNRFCASAMRSWK